MLSCGFVNAQAISGDFYYRCGLYAVCLATFLVGEYLLKLAVLREDAGVGIYSLKMVVLFTYIYNTVVNSQIRIILGNFPGDAVDIPAESRLVAFWVHSLLQVAYLRFCDFVLR